MNYILESKTYKLILLFVSISTSICFSQKTVNEFNQKAYNDKLQSVDLDSLLKAVNTITVVSNTSCIGCVEYLLKQGICTNFVYLIDNLSIIEMNRAKFKTTDTKCHFYFIISKFDTIIEINERSPILIYLENDSYTIFNYDELNKLTCSFTSNGRVVRKELKKRKN